MCVCWVDDFISYVFIRNIFNRVRKILLVRLTNNKEQIVNKSKKTDKPCVWVKNERSSDDKRITVGEIDRNTTAHSCTFNLMKKSFFFEINHRI